MRHPIRTPALLLSALFLAVVAGGCTNYNYTIVRPEVPQPLITAKESGGYESGPVRYRFDNVDNRLVIRVFNNTSDVIELMPQSSLVDPEGQARPIKPQTILPGAFARIVLPPIKPRIESTGVGLGVGVGFSSGPGAYRDEYGMARRYDEPRYYTVEDGGEVYWSWRGEGEVQLYVVIEPTGGEIHRDHLIIRRIKAE